MEHVIEWNDYNHNILPLNEIPLEDNDDDDDDDDADDTDDDEDEDEDEEDDDLNIHDPDMWLDQLNGKNNSLHMND